ncbi:hypothetical protein GXN76_05740 [Kroppenstedtia pulmonis]|uniref:Uncharacterized protein n=1 Tax=Kroppenstedtia pulmonis TaxID=1380685 RepID=A0A7D3Y917_9BACL|nr:hypothetical protein [Kroppenstedtia pulmonis]QKG84021.1 hypothetical protein GXN76_05740 [Kroppenstedtia pulmonis]
MNLGKRGKGLLGELREEIAKRPKGKRAVAVAKKGKKAERSFGDHQSTCTWNRTGLKKLSR